MTNDNQPGPGGERDTRGIHRPHRHWRAEVLGLAQWFPTTADGTFSYGPNGARGPQLFFYQALEAGNYSRHRPGLQHLAFMVASRAIVREAHAWAVAHGAEILHEPREFPEYGEHYATYWLDPHGFMLEAVSFEADAS